MGAVVGQCNNDMNPQAPVGELITVRHGTRWVYEVPRVAQGTENVEGTKTMKKFETYRFLEGAKADLSLLLALHGVVKKNTSLQDMQLPLIKNLDIWEKGASRVLERIRKTATQYNS